jgi:hypothetical protein
MMSLDTRFLVLTEVVEEKLLYRHKNKEKCRKKQRGGNGRRSERDVKRVRRERGMRKATKKIRITYTYYWPTNIHQQEKFKKPHSGSFKTETAQCKAVLSCEGTSAFPFQMIIFFPRYHTLPNCCHIRPDNYDWR